MNNCILYGVHRVLYSPLYIPRDHRLEFSAYDILVFLFLEDCFITAKIVDLAEMPQFAAFQLGPTFCKVLIYGQTCKQMPNSSFPISCTY